MKHGELIRSLWEGIQYQTKINYHCAHTHTFTCTKGIIYVCINILISKTQDGQKTNYFCLSPQCLSSSFLAVLFKAIKIFKILRQSTLNHLNSFLSYRTLLVKILLIIPESLHFTSQTPALCDQSILAFPQFLE